MKHAESALQKTCIKWFDYQHPECSVMVEGVKYKNKRKIKVLRRVSILFSIPNEGESSEILGSIMNQMGRRVGVGDTLLAKGRIKDWKEIHHLDILARNIAKFIYLGCFFEFKSKTGKQTKEQAAFQKLVEAQGYEYVIIKDIESFISKVKEYM